MKVPKNRKRHLLVRDELSERVQRRVALARSLAERTRMMIARLDRQLESSRRTVDPFAERISKSLV